RPGLAQLGVKTGRVECLDDCTAVGSEPVALVAIQLVTLVETPNRDLWSLTTIPRECLHPSRQPAAHRGWVTTHMGLDVDRTAANIANLVDGQQGITEVVQNAEEENDIELSQLGRVEVVNRLANEAYTRIECLLQAREADRVGVLQCQRDNFG